MPALRNLKPQACRRPPPSLSAPENLSSSRTMKSRKQPARASDVLPSTTPAYPARLRQIYDPPVVLCIRGNVSALSQPGIAVIGTRHPTPYGIGMAERLASDLAVRGFVIFSGLARGVDTAAHRGAVAAKGKTVAVLGTGADVFIPRKTPVSLIKSSPSAER